MNANINVPLSGRAWTASELRALPFQTRDAILAAAAEDAAALYASDSQLTAFEAFGPDDLHGESSNSTPG